MRRFGSRTTAVAAVSIGILLVTTTSCTSRERTTVNASDSSQRACARCHGARGEGGSPAAEGAAAPRDFTERAWQESRSSAEIAAVVRSGKGAMPSFEGVLSAEEIEAAVTTVRSLGGDF